MSLGNTTEAQVIGQCNRWLKREHPDILFRRNHNGAGVSTGWPDFVYLLPNGRALWIEYKAPGGVPTKLQAERIKQLALRNHHAYVIDDVERFKVLIEQYVRIPKWK